MSVDSSAYLTLAAVLFALGLSGVVLRRNILVMFMCVELMLNAVNLTFVTFARKFHDVTGQAMMFFVMVVAAAEVVIGLAIIMSAQRRRRGVTADDLDELAG